MMSTAKPPIPLQSEGAHLYKLSLPSMQNLPIYIGKYAMSGIFASMYLALMQVLFSLLNSLKSLYIMPSQSQWDLILCRYLVLFLLKELTRVPPVLLLLKAPCYLLNFPSSHQLSHQPLHSLYRHLPVKVLYIF